MRSSRVLRTVPGLPTATGYAHCVVSPAGRLVSVAGQLGAGADGNIVGDSLVEQFDAALGNVVLVLAAAGSSVEQVANLLILTTTMSEYKRQMREIGVSYRRHFGTHYPAMALVGVTELYDDAAKVEIVATAVIPEPG